MLLLNLLLLLFCQQIQSRSITKEDPINLNVEISTGLIRGIKDKTVEAGKIYYAFRGIPFAEAPVGALRFKPPVPKKPWKGVVSAEKDGPSCIQGSNPVTGEEDCLSMNVYTTQYPGTNDTLLPIMVFVYGGGFMGGISTYNQSGPDYLLDKDVLAITFNYRLGILGFLATGDLASPGNNGLRDQALALRWVQQNARRFGGDPARVTLFGQSAGSAAVSYLLQSNRTAGLFQRAIMESGVSLCLWTYARHSMAMTRALAGALRIPTDSNEALVDGLRKLNATHLQATVMQEMGKVVMQVSAREGFLYAPVYEPQHEDAFITEPSHVQLSRGDFQKVPCIIGYNSLEGTFDIGGLLRLILAKWDIEPNKIVPVDLNISAFLKRYHAALEIKGRYFGLIPAAFSSYQAQLFIGDDQFVRPIREYVRLLSKHVPVYYYRFSYEGGLWGFTNRTQSGVAHSEELGYLFRSPYKANAQDELVRKRMVAMWTNFAKTGKPTLKNDPIVDVTWSKASAGKTGDLVYLEIGKQLNIGVNPDGYNMKFWDQIYKTYGHPPYNTY